MYESLLELDFVYRWVSVPGRQYPFRQFTANSDLSFVPWRRTYVVEIYVLSILISSVSSGQTKVDIMRDLEFILTLFFSFCSRAWRSRRMLWWVDRDHRWWCTRWREDPPSQRERDSPVPHSLTQTNPACPGQVTHLLNLYYKLCFNLRKMRTEVEMNFLLFRFSLGNSRDFEQLKFNLKQSFCKYDSQISSIIFEDHNALARYPSWLWNLGHASPSVQKSQRGVSAASQYDWFTRFINRKFTKTRMHFSRMRTVRNSSRLLGWGVPGPGEGGIPACTEADPSPVNRMTDRQV